VCDPIGVQQVFVPMTIIQGWTDAASILRAADELLNRLSDEYEDHHLTIDQAGDLRRAGLSSLQAIDFSPSETFGPETLRLTFVVEEWKHPFVLLMSKKHPTRRYVWGVLVEE